MQSRACTAGDFLFCGALRGVCFATRVYHCGLNVSLAQGNLLFGAHLMCRHFVELLGAGNSWLKRVHALRGYSLSFYDDL